MIILNTFVFCIILSAVYIVAHLIYNINPYPIEREKINKLMLDLKEINNLIKLCGKFDDKLTDMKIRKSKIIIQLNELKEYSDFFNNNNKYDICIFIINIYNTILDYLCNTCKKYIKLLFN